MNKINIYFLIVILGLAGCTSLQSGFCTVRGGEPYVNLGGYAFCGTKYNDAGKVCKSSDECEGDCVLPWSWKPDEEREVVGQCAADSTYNFEYGCVAIEHHKTYQGGCIEDL
ncbi:hypothetical protein [Saccharophagus degradans]|uniref:PAS/PAC sensor hybrid histidine kinase n=1 Tax=Saccharophagus degradans (strain 2-40 / ATCC 43961 / DSM 17024) TaxID=203122 RepID=Q21G35_SACD2|nr:hypothetical protein [Saccharophagus degradans]ABD82344.1 PAS/PAC sensor hybrid histidine kinase [Saccharophagus degradans 2-40]